MTTKESPARAGLYWRRGSRVTPGIMTLDGGVLSFAATDGEVFRAPVAAVEAVFSTFSTLSLTVGGATYRFVTGAYAGALAPRFTTEQLALLTGDSAQEANSRFAAGAATIVTSSVVGNAAALVGSIVGRGGAIVGQAIGVTNLFASQRESFALARAWAEHLAGHGVAVRMRGTTFARSQAVIAAIVIPALAVFGVAVFALLSALS